LLLPTNHPRTTHHALQDSYDGGSSSADDSLEFLLEGDEFGDELEALMYDSGDDSGRRGRRRQQQRRQS
jgi:hypothetical protein